MILYGKTRYRLFMKIDLYDTFRILKEKGYFGDPINAPPQKWDPYAGIGISEVKNWEFFIL